MRKEVSTTELREKFGELLDRVHHNGDRLIVKRANRPLAAIVLIETYEEMLQQREKTFSVLDRIWEKVPVVSEEEAQADIEQTIAEGRAEIACKRSTSCLPDAQLYWIRTSILVQLSDFRYPINHFKGIGIADFLKFSIQFLLTSSLAQIRE